MKISCFVIILYVISEIQSTSSETKIKLRISDDQDGRNSAMQPRRQRIYEDTIKFKYLTKSNKKNNFFKADESPIRALKDVDINVPLKFVTHDSTDNCESNEMCKSIANKYLEMSNPSYQVIMADYSILATPLEYLTIAKHSWRVAEIFAFVLNELLDKGMKPIDIHMIGFGLGAHICGYTAEIVNSGLMYEKVGRITGLDPPLLFFEVSTDGINKDQAMFVDIVHTSVGVVGVADARGHVDFYPNAGLVPQPHCEHISEGTHGLCSHRASWHWFHKSIGNTNIKAYSCSSFTRFTYFECSRTKEMIFGDNTPLNAIGVFYFKGSFK